MDGSEVLSEPLADQAACQQLATAAAPSMLPDGSQFAPPDPTDSTSSADARGHTVARPASTTGPNVQAAAAHMKLQHRKVAAAALQAIPKQKRKRLNQASEQTAEPIATKRSARQAARPAAADSKEACRSEAKSTRPAGMASEHSKQVNARTEPTKQAITKLNDAPSARTSRRNGSTGKKDSPRNVSARANNCGKGETAEEPEKASERQLKRQRRSEAAEVRL